jgi:hypothetical protein
MTHGLDTTTTAGVIREARRVMFAGPRGRALELVDELRDLDADDAANVLESAIESATDARRAWAAGDELEAQAHEARVWALAEALDDLALELEWADR